MHFMNSIEIDEARCFYCDHPVLGPATETLQNLRNAVDDNSDGWAYWPKPVRAARQLIELIEGARVRLAYRNEYSREDATVEKLRKAYRPIKAFRTRTGIQFDIIEP